MTRNGRVRAGVIILMALADVTAAQAAGKISAQKRAQVLQAVVDCRPMTDAAARLACYDAAAARLDEAEASGQVVIVDKEQARQVRREVFGLQLPSLDIFGRAAKTPGAAPEEVDRIVETVKSASRQADGRWVLELETGAVWRQIDASELANDPHPGSKVDIRNAALGSFFMKVDGQPAIRVHRDR